MSTKSKEFNYKFIHKVESYTLTENTRNIVFERETEIRTRNLVCNIYFHLGSGTIAPEKN
jgi:hypothetical protein